MEFAKMSPGSTAPPPAMPFAQPDLLAMSPQVRELQARCPDERAFADPDRFDVARHPNPHLTFGYGPRFCIGAPPARIELQTVFGRLFRRFPALRLAVPAAELAVRHDLLTGGLTALPVTW